MGLSSMVKLHFLPMLCSAALFFFAFAKISVVHAACKTFEASHNGTDMFYATGTEGTVKNKLLWYVEQWQKENNVKKVRIGKIHVTCGGWFIKYALPHRNCKAKSRVCY